MTEPVDMILHCPKCGTQHIDKPDPEKGWTNPPHRSHLCAACGTIWRPADVATNGVTAILTRGKLDTYRPKPDRPPSLLVMVAGGLGAVVCSGVILGAIAAVAYWVFRAFTGVGS